MHAIRVVGLAPEQLHRRLQSVGSYPDNGATVHIRLGWSPRGKAFRQTIHEARDGGRTWRLVEYVDFARAPP